MEIRRVASAFAAAAVAGLLALGVNQAVLTGGTLEAVPAPDSRVEADGPEPVDTAWAGTAVRAALLAGPDAADVPGADGAASHDSTGRLPVPVPAAVPTVPEPTTPGSRSVATRAPKPRPAAVSRDRGLGNVAVTTGRLLSKPLEGRMTSRFGIRFHPILRVWKLHTGLDFAAPCGTAVGAAAPGTVIRTGWAGGNGMQVKVDHGRIGGYHVVTTYNHLSAIGVRVGQQVAVHQGLGRVGNTGYSTGCHLHLEVIANGHFTNPEAWLNGSAAPVDTAGMGTSGPGTSRPTPTRSPSPSPSASASPSPSASASPSPSASASPSPSESPSPSQAPSGSPSPSESATTPPASLPPCPTESATPGAGSSPSPSPSPCVTPSPSDGAGSPSPTQPGASETPSPTSSGPGEPSPTPPASSAPTSPSATVSLAQPTPSALTPTPAAGPGESTGPTASGGGSSASSVGDPDPVPSAT